MDYKPSANHKLLDLRQAWLSAIYPQEGSAELKVHFQANVSFSGNNKHGRWQVVKFPLRETSLPKAEQEAMDVCVDIKHSAVLWTELFINSSILNLCIRWLSSSFCSFYERTPVILRNTAPTISGGTATFLVASSTVKVQIRRETDA